MDTKIIKVNNVSMEFNMASDRTLYFKEYILKKVKNEIKYKKFRAIDNVSFEVEKGMNVGLIGHNGAGKSTLLKLISGILKPTTGDITVSGNIVPMLELGSGFDMDMTGEENIFLNGAVLGYAEDYLKSKYREIVDFSDLGDFIFVPIRNYSSGMLMRLAFSIATVVEPEILIVDEILSVGDAYFQEKSRKRMEELMSGGTTVLYVSHNIEQLMQICQKTIWLDHGRIVMYGDSAEVCMSYINSVTT
ncbi:MAG: ABC transporter ATP-binding protein [Lachnospiraceae bacterium]|nr:ABC transporter ATP-binding protein [Lachnospiraceae bacterium]